MKPSLRRRAVTALGGLLLAGGVLAAPLRAHEPDVRVMFEDLEGQPVEETVHDRRDLVIHGQAEHEDVPPVDRVELMLSAPGLSDRCEVPTYEPVPAAEASDFRRPLLAPSCNGTWTIAATAVTADDDTFGHGVTRALATDTYQLAVPPADPTGVTAVAEGEDGAAERSVTVSWLANQEPDLVGYRIDRAEPGASFELLAVVEPAEQPSYVDDDLPEGGEHRYRVYAVRQGVTPDDADLVTSIGPGEASAEVAQPPETTTTTAGETTSTTGATTAAPSRSGAPRPRAATGPRTATTVDSGFAGTLPFDPSRTTLPEPPADDAPDGVEPPADDALVALSDDGSGEDDTRGLLVPVAGSLALLVVAAHVRHVVRQASAPEEVIGPV